MKSRFGDVSKQSSANRSLRWMNLFPEELWVNPPSYVVITLGLFNLYYHNSYHDFCHTTTTNIFNFVCNFILACWMVAFDPLNTKLNVSLILIEWREHAPTIWNCYWCLQRRFDKWRIFCRNYWKRGNCVTLEVESHVPSITVIHTKEEPFLYEICMGKSLIRASTLILVIIIRWLIETTCKLNEENVKPYVWPVILFTRTPKLHIYIYIYRVFIKADITLAARERATWASITGPPNHCLCWIEAICTWLHHTL